MSAPAPATAPEDPDRLAVRRVLAGDCDAFGEVVARHEVDLRRVQGWASGTIANEGVAIKNTGGVNGARFRSSDHNDGLRPSLELTYTP